jgi:hypothetical protein
MRITIVCACLLLQVSSSLAQVSESFDYQNISEAVSWKGTDTAWQVQAGRLQSRLRQPNASFYISTPSLLARNAIWECWLQLDFNTSSLNYTDLFLLADSANLLSPGVSGYFVRVGNTKDDICLYRKDGKATPVLLIDGRDGITNHSSTTLHIRVTRTDQGWELWTNEANGSAYVREGGTADSTYNTTRFTGIVVRQSNASFFARHYFDDLKIFPIVEDTIAPILQSFQLIDDHTLKLCFSEAPDSSSIADVAHFRLSDPANVPTFIESDSSEPSCIYVKFKHAFPNGDSCHLLINGIADLQGNLSDQMTVSFLYYTSTGYDVLIHEFLPRALPSAGLLPARFVELKNNSPYILQLKNWRLANSSREVILPAYTFQPGSLLVVCDRSAVGSFPGDVPLLGVSSFPAPGDSDIITLRNDSGVLVHAVGYDRHWYDNPVKQKGGWSLEMVDINWPCAGSSNWRPSIAPSGGTPGKPNTVMSTGVLPPPVSLISAYAVDSMTVILSFSGIMDSLAAADVAYYQFSPAISIADVAVQPPLYNNVVFRLGAPLLRDTSYLAAVSGLRDCTGQDVTMGNDIAFARISTADSLDIVINEILYDPAPGTPEFVEIYNRGRKAVNLEQVYLARRKESGALEDVTALSSNPHTLLPGSYAAFTGEPAALCTQYDCRQPGNVHQLNLPPLTNEDGIVSLLNAAGQVVDQLHYSDKMHMALASHTRGVSLERLLADGPTQDWHNWHSAATIANGTPGYTNSQRIPSTVLPGVFTVQPAVFSPDQDGLDDIAVIRYSFSTPGFVVNVTIFDAEGRPVRQLERNTLLPASGYMIWDGLGDSGRGLISGIYVIFAEAFNTDGQVSRWKLPIVLGKRVNS